MYRERVLEGEPGKCFFSVESSSILIDQSTLTEPSFLSLRKRKYWGEYVRTKMRGTHLAVELTVSAANGIVASTHRALPQGGLVLKGSLCTTSPTILSHRQAKLHSLTSHIPCSNDPRLRFLIHSQKGRLHSSWPNSSRDPKKSHRPKTTVCPHRLNVSATLIPLKPQQRSPAPGHPPAAAAPASSASAPPRWSSDYPPCR